MRLSKNQLPVYGDGRARCATGFMCADHGRALRLVLEEGRPGEVYVIGGLNRKSRNLDLRVRKQLCSALDELRPRDGGRSL